MGLFDEIERNIKAAMQDARARQEMQRPQQPAARAPQPQQRPRQSPLPPETHETYAQHRAQHSPSSQQQHHPAGRHYKEDGSLAPESINEKYRREQNAKLAARKQEREQKSVLTKQVAKQSTQTLLKEMLSSKNGLAAAFLAQEILGPPKAMRRR